MTSDIYGNTLRQRLTIFAKGEDVHGTLGGDALVGRVSGNHLHFVATDKRNNTTEVDARVDGDKVTGEMSVTFSNAPKEHVKHFFGHALEERPAGPTRTVEFKPTKFYNRFSAEIAPVLTIWPGDTIHTQTIDSGGVEEHGVTKALYGNPETGPFYVGGAESGDVLAVHIKRLRLNRNYADSIDAVAERVNDSRLRWNLDLQAGVAKPDTPTEHLKDFTVPLKPMLGCVGVAPDSVLLLFLQVSRDARAATWISTRSQRVRLFSLTSHNQARCYILGTATPPWATEKQPNGRWKHRWMSNSRWM